MSLVSLAWFSELNIWCNAVLNQVCMEWRCAKICVSCVWGKTGLVQMCLVMLGQVF